MQLLEQAAEGPRLVGSTPLDAVEAQAEGQTSLVVVFEAFRDGRGFSLAATLRERGWRHRLVAAGDVLPDQARHLHRSGFDAVELPPGSDPGAWRRMLGAFTTVYQPATDPARPARPAWNRRAARPPAAVDTHALARTLNARLAGADATTILRTVLDPGLGLKIAVLSSFGAEAAVLLDHVAEADPAIPVIFLETGQHFLQTLSYRRQLSEQLGLSDVRIVIPDPAELARIDPTGTLWQTDPDACCDLRKVRPLARAAEGFTALITGRKRHQARTRHGLDIVEVVDGSLRINPVAAWVPDQIAAHAEARDLPRHPLVDQGYASIGCWPCTQPVDSGEDRRAGRWSGVDKVECGIHLGRRQAALSA